MTKRLRVLFITSWYPNPKDPIEGIFVREHAKAVQIYNDVVVLHLAGNSREESGLWHMQQEVDPELIKGIATYRVTYRLLPVPKSSYSNYVWSAVQAARTIVQQGFRPDIIHAHIYRSAVPAAVVAKMLGIPMVLTEHSSDFPRRLLSPLQVRLARLAMTQAKVVMPVSSALQRAIQDHGIHAEFKIIPNTVDTGIYYPAAKRLLQLNRTLRLLFVGSLTSNKGIRDLLQALARLKQQRADWHLKIIGHGPLRHEYETMAASLGIAALVSFLGIQTRHQVAETMRQTDLFVLPSHYETFSVVTAEALATGLPVLVTRCGGVEEFVTPDVGMLVSPGNLDDLLLGLSYMMDHVLDFSPVEISQYAQSRFCLSSVGASINDVYCSVRSGK